MSMNDVIAQNISNLLKSSNKKQQDLADALNMPKQTISKILNGARMVSATELSQIAKYFNVSMDSLVQEKTNSVFSQIKVFMGDVKSETGKNAIKTAEKLMDLYLFHHKFQTKEYIEKTNACSNKFDIRLSFLCFASADAYSTALLLMKRTNV